MNTSLKNIPTYPEIQEATQKIGLDQETLKELSDMGLSRIMAQMICYNHDLTAAELRELVNSRSELPKNQLGTRVYRDSLEKQGLEKLVEHNNAQDQLDEITTFESGATKIEKSIAYKLGQARYRIKDMAFQIMYNDGDNALLGIDMEKGVDKLHEEYKDEIDELTAGMSMIDLDDAMKGFKSYPDFKSANTFKARLFLKAKTHEITEGVLGKARSNTKNKAVTNADNVINKFGKGGKAKTPSKTRNTELEVAA